MSLNAKKYSMLRRKHKKEFLLNEYEINAFDNYCKQFKVSNKSKIIREALFEKVLKGLENKHPTLFSKEELLRLEKR